MEGIPTLVVVTKEGKLLTDEGDEQVSGWYLEIMLMMMTKIMVVRR